jgi:hypothetical protein
VSVIDTVAVTWGDLRVSSAPRLARGAVEPLADPVRLDFNELADRLGRDDGQVQLREYHGQLKAYGHWKVGHVDLMYGHSGRLELRCALPKLLLDRNDELLSEHGVHEALSRLTQIGWELTGVYLELGEAVPTRLDLCYQWPVPSVTETLEWIKAGFAPARKKRTETVSAYGGPSLVYGYGAKRLFRFYDKALETREQGDESAHAPDTLLRFEIQERRRGVLRLIHENGYRADDVREHLQQALDPLATLLAGSLEGYLDQLEDSRGRISSALGYLYLAEHGHVWPLIKKRVSESTYYALRQKARQASLAVTPWMPVIPDDAFSDGIGGLGRVA